MKLLLQTFVLILVFHSATAQLTRSNHQEIDKIFERLYTDGKIPGGILLAEGENVIYQNAFGMADPNLEITNTVKTRFTINSMGKMFSAILVLQLVEDDSISLDDPISMHLPWFKHSRAADIRIHHLLSYRFVLRDYFYEQMEGKLDFFISQREILSQLAKYELQFEPGGCFDYCNTGYLLLGEIVMTYRNADFPDILRNRIFEKLGMSNTYLSPSVYGPGTPVYYLQNGSAATPYPYSFYSGDGGSNSTYGDLHKYMLALDSVDLLTIESWALMFQKHSLPLEATRPFGAHFNTYGYGFSFWSYPMRDRIRPWLLDTEEQVQVHQIIC